MAQKKPQQSSSKKKKQKQPTQRPVMQRVKVMGPSGKLRLEWREW